MKSVSETERREAALRCVKLIKNTSVEHPVTVVGSANTDYTVKAPRIPNPGETIIGGDLEVLPGGKSANQAAACSRLGVTATFIGCVGSDGNAGFLKDELNKANVDTTQMTTVAGPSGATLITVDENGQNSIVVAPGANAHLTGKVVEDHADVIRQARCVGLCLETPIDTVLAAARLAYAADVLTVVNFSPFNASYIHDLSAVTSLLLVNEIECAQILNAGGNTEISGSGVTLNDDWDNTAARLHETGFQRSIVTLGANGCVLLDEDTVEHIPAASCRAVDTTGCGDAFMGSILAGLAVGATVTEAACLATFVASSAAEYVGAQRSYRNLEDISI